MRLDDDTVTLSATDVANHLACRHLTSLDLQVARGHLSAPWRHAPDAALLKQRGLEHERRYLASLRASGVTIVDLSDGPMAEDPMADDVSRTLDAMRRGAGAVAQAVLWPADAGRWRGRADLLLRVEVPSGLGDWSYEVVDTKLARETRGGTVLQLCAYSELLASMQGKAPDAMHVVTPGRPFVHERFRRADFEAYYRVVKGRLEAAIRTEADGGYPEPRSHCDRCRWAAACAARRRADDHLSLVAGISRLQTTELQARAIVTVGALAREPVPLAWTPARGSTEALERVREQARVQVAGRAADRPVYELLLPIEPNRGLARLPEPSPGDIFLDLEGDPFAGQGGREYLFGYVCRNDDGDEYHAVWALRATEDRRAFEAFMDFVSRRSIRFPDLHIYHYAPYEPSAFRRLMGRYATREDEMDRLLRGERFVDLHAVLRQGIRASVERYSLKDLEPFHGFTRQVDLHDANAARQQIERAIEMNLDANEPQGPRAGALAAALGEDLAEDLGEDLAEDLGEDLTEAVQRVELYNRDDCLSTLQLRDWLEARRRELMASGTDVPRPVPKADAPPEELSARQERVRDVQARLLADIPQPSGSGADASSLSPSQQARGLLAHLLEWHRREDKAGWWEYYRLIALSDEDLLNERAAISMLTHDRFVGALKRSEVHRYRFPPQETQVRAGDELMTTDEKTLGSVIAIDAVQGFVDIKQGPKRLADRPTAVFEHSHVNKGVIEEALLRIGECVATQGIEGDHGYAAARHLLLRAAPRSPSHAPDSGDSPSNDSRSSDSTSDGALQRADESPIEAACRLANALDGGVLAIQGPPGSGKTYAGGELVASLIAAGKRVGVTALSHKVIQHQLEAIAEACARRGVPVRRLQKVSELSEVPLPTGSIVETTDNAEVLRSFDCGACHVAGGTAWLWARPELADAIDVLVVDEAAQMSLADVLAASQAARSLVLLGDPCQLDQPTQGSHPDGCAVSALEHLLAGSRTMPAERGLFLGETWRLAPAIGGFTSETFYEGRLRSRPGLERQQLIDAGPFDGAGLWLVPVDHHGNQNESPEEVEAVCDVVRSLSTGASWVDADGVTRRLTRTDILVVAPYNAHVFALTEALPSGTRIGTVDKFQGQEAPVVIYSMASSSPEEAPRGMGFLYSANRLNVATSRARCASILVASPRLFEPECRTVEQLRLANALCRYAELARRVLPDASKA